MPAAALIAVLLASLLAATAARAGETDDRYLAGYAAAVLEMRFGAHAPAPRVRDGVLVLDPAVLEGHDAEAVVAALERIEGLEVRLAGADAGGPAAAPAPPPPPDGETAPADARLGPLPTRSVFRARLADPRWPHFSASAQAYQDDRELENVAATNMGTSLPLYGWEALGAHWQLGLHAGVFSIFDLDSESFDLINADYLVGVPIGVRRGPFSAQVRLFHQSSHLGDEFLLRNRVERINLSYEAVDVLLSADVLDWVEVYGGAGAIIRSEPDLQAFSVQGGVQTLPRRGLLPGPLSPVLALDLKAAEETDWDLDYSLRAGVEIHNAPLAERRLQFLFEYFNGRSPNGQFFARTIEYFGVGVHFYF